MTFICENCEHPHDGLWASGRFCSSKCSRGFSTKNKRQEINNKVSKKLVGRIASKETRDKLKASWANNPNYLNRKSKHKKKIEDLTSPIQIKKRLFEDNIKKRCCEDCSQGEIHNGKPLGLQLHHLDGNNKNNKIENLQILCPNCHTQTSNYAVKNKG